jgi:inorganic pyrophosphatase
MVYAYIDITAYGSIKYEVDKVTGYLLVDRPHRTSPPHRPVVPRGGAALFPKAEEGDACPLGICLVSE